MKNESFRTVAIRTEIYESLRKLVDSLNKEQQRTKDGIPVILRIADVTSAAIEDFCKKYKIK